MIAAALLLAQTAAAPPSILRGERIFAQNCSVGYCHGAGGAASRGPRLHGRRFETDYLYKVTRDGIPNSAMPAWKDRLKDGEIRDVVEYVSSLASAGPVVQAEPMPSGPVPSAAPAIAEPAAVSRGRALFFDPTRANCGACHAVGARGIAIAPDLMPVKSAGEISNAVHATHSQHVLTATLKDGDKFPALPAEQSANQVRLFDLTLAPPVLRSFAREDVASLAPNPTWRHADFVEDYSLAEIEGIAQYLLWAAKTK
ncbi:MAG TPA: c-type cytochrome [Bryobacteraceae bacterium]|nr:c-type cytochrome [Bryobacteraceae bacterium]